MGLLDSVIGNLMGGAGGGASPMAGVLTSLLGGGMGQNQGQGMSGGLSGIVSSFEQAGLGHIAQSWVANGPNQPVSPQQLQNVMGDDQVHSMASQAGMQPNDFLSQLSEHLPNAVHAMTPDGRLPEGTISV
ncbi:YidB family protein [Acidisoma sp. L85]|uniref:YidB family protein n=1 Tax=Acidisoma sp. L85 TaxID=1641850 RepID=UPI00131C5A9C|nr:YidB family protein [Acidisoma sp. L85]